ncbi:MULTISPECIES: ABC transporter permease [unclassified Enterococcus]|uniref:ABC transporter permease n=1 Tax=unclassified Enterococcus TaxID=2608891 RepID=UPI00259BA0F5|nr:MULTISPECIES: ABC transporter permease [unclassified Enterococcus]MDO0920409.1 ABC transporter permease [Enterococcus sp. B1E2]WIV17001.1 ABC transporter permease [Enterococcus sp. FZMF]
MFQYIVKRILWLFPILIGVSFIVFTIMYLSPGDPVTMVLGEGATPEQYEAMRVQMGLDRSFIEQFFHYIKNVVVEFDLGRSYFSGRVVMDENPSPFAQHNQIISMECVICLADWYSTGSDLCFETLFQG